MNIKQKFNLIDKVALVTGGGQGIGKSIAIALAEFGCNLAIFDINLENATSVAKEIEEIGRKAIALKCDVSNYKEVEKNRDIIIKEYGHIDILINNAGVKAPQIPLEEMSLDTWNSVINVNLTGVFICSSLIGKQMIKQKKGKIVNIASLTSLIAVKNVYVGPYAAAKGGVLTLTKSMANDWVNYNIQVNSIAPGFIKTPMNDQLSADDKWSREINELIPMKRLGLPEEIASLAVFLCSDAASYMTGENVVVDGGYTII